VWISKFLSRLSPRALAVVVFVVVFGGTGGVVGYFFNDAIRFRTTLMRSLVASMCEDVAELVDVELHETLVKPSQLDSDEYRRALAPLAQYHLRHKNLVYVVTVREDKSGREQIVLDTTQDSAVVQKARQLGRVPKPSALLEPYRTSRDQAAADLALKEGRTHVFPDFYSDAYGTFIEARAPLVDRKGNRIGYAAVDFDADVFATYLNEVRLAGLVTLGLALLLSLAITSAAWGMRRRTREYQAQIEAAEAAERAQRDAAEKANAAKSELLAIASHDLKNPLSAIAGISGLMLQMKKASATPGKKNEDLEALETIHGSAKHMSDIVRGILFNEGVESGGLPFQPSLVNLESLCREVIKFNAAAAAKKTITLRFDTEGNLSGQFDPKLLREAVDNYLSNAIKYSPADRATTITLSAKATAEAVVISVQDQGPGLTQDDQSKAFGKFKKLSARPTAGETSSGLGLSIVKKIAELHGGTVGCDSQPGQGACFWLRLPIKTS
jgi:signal transduction histidine kinase